MKNKSIIAAFVLLVAANTNFLWEEWSGMFGVTVLLMLVWIILIFVFALKLGSILLDLFFNKIANWGFVIRTALLGLLLMLVYLFPFGILRPDMFEDPPIMLAKRIGTANCSTTIALKENRRFLKSTVCFNVKKELGTYSIQGDTVLFQFDEGSAVGSALSFGILNLSLDTSKSSIGSLVYYRNNQDTLPLTFKLIKFDEEKLRPY